MARENYLSQRQRLDSRYAREPLDRKLGCAVRWKPDSSSAYLSKEIKQTGGFAGVAALAAGKAATLWVGIARSGKGLGLQQFSQGVSKGASFASVHLHLQVWWGIGLLAIGGLYLVHFRPGRTK